MRGKQDTGGWGGGRNGRWVGGGVEDGAHRSRELKASFASAAGVNKWKNFFETKLTAW